MSDNPVKNKVGTGGSLTFAGAIGGLMILGVPLVSKDPELVTLLNAGVPILSAVISYFLTYLVNRFGFESPQDAALRKKIKTSIKVAKRQIKCSESTEEMKNEAREQLKVAYRMEREIGLDELPSNSQKESATHNQSMATD